MISASQAFHVGVTAYYVVVSHWLMENMVKQKEYEILDQRLKTVKRLFFRYLTTWTFALQTIFFVIALGEEVLLLFKKGEKIKARVKALKNYLFSSLVAPMALLVSTIFWSIWMVDRELIFPSIMDKVLPSWANHALHTTTSVLVLCEMYLSFHKYPAFKAALQGITLYLLFYSFCLTGTYLESGVWLYPIFKKLNWTLRIAICLAVYILAIAFYAAGYLMNRAMWDDNVMG